MEHDGYGDTSCGLCTWNIPLAIGKGTGRIGNKKTRLLHHLDRTEYWEESWRLEETCCLSNSYEKLSANAGVKNFQRRK